MTIYVGCVSPAETITPVELDKYNNEFKPGMTQDDINTITQRKREEVEANSIGRKIPKVIIMGLDSVETELSKIIHKKTLVALTGAHCSWGMTGLEEDLPKAAKKLKENDIDLPIVCLIIKDSSDYKDPKSFNDVLKRLNVIYPQIYIIDKQESDKLNVYANPTRLLINKNKILEYIGIGVSTTDGLFRELKMVTANNYRRNKKN